MQTVKLGKTGIVTNKNAFGALPIQRVSDDEAVKLLRKAYENGITFLIRPDGIQTANIRWDLPLRGCGIRSLSRPRQGRRMRKDSGRIWRPAFPI